MPRKKPNVVFITLDSARADHFGCYGYARNTSPHIDLLAAQGVRFEHAISQASWTSASVASIMTSSYPEYEMKEAGYSLSPLNKNIVRVLKENGYRTLLFSNALPILEVTLSNIKMDFDVFHMREVKADALVDTALPHVLGKERSPFFLWLYLFDTHVPYTADTAYYKDFLNDRTYVRKDVRIIEDDGIKNQYYSFGGIPRHAALDGRTDTGYYIARYDGGIRYADEQVGRLLASFRARGMDKDTLFVIFADHGESMGEHDFYFNHSHYVYDSFVRVPLIMALPGKLPAKVVHEQVSMLNLMPTVMAITGIKEHPHMEGKNILPLLKGGVQRIDPYIYSKTSFFPAPIAVRTDAWKLIYVRAKDVYELYDLKSDPQELNNVVSVRSDVAEGLMARLAEWSKAVKMRGVAGAGDASSAVKDKLRSLGYMQSGH